MNSRLVLAAGGALGAAVWALVQPLDKRVARHDYDDVEILGKLVTRQPGWYPAGLALHVINGAAFGLAYSELRRRTPRVPAHVTAQSMAQAENFALFPLSSLIDRYHPARDELARIWGQPRALAQATWRHALLGLVLGEVARRRA